MPGFRRGFGVKKDREDNQDIVIADLIGLKAIGVLIKFLLLDIFSKRIEAEFLIRDSRIPIFDQGEEPLCAAFTAATAKSYQETRQYNQPIIVSTRYIYNVAKKKFDITPNIPGISLRDALMVLRKFGVPQVAYWPNEIKDINDLIVTQKVLDYQAGLNKILTFIRLTNSKEMMLSLKINPTPLLCAVEVFESWFSPQVITTGIIPMPKKGEKSIDQHAVAVDGYSRAFFPFQNSWGEIWGNKGYGTMSREYIEKFMVDCWAIYDMPSEDLAKNLITMVQKYSPKKLWIPEIQVA